MPRLRALVTHETVVRVGYLTATVVGTAWGAVLGTVRLEKRGGVIVAHGCPRWAFGRYGLLFAVRYLAAGPVAAKNRFEVEAGLEKGGYR